MGGFPYAIFIGVIAFIITSVGIIIKNRAWILVGMFLSLTTASPIMTFTRGAAGAIVASDVVAIALLPGIIFGGFYGISTSVVPSWRNPFIVLFIVFILSVSLVASWNTQNLDAISLAKIYIRIPFLSLVTQITIFRLLRICLWAAFFFTIAKLIVNENDLCLIFRCFLIVAFSLAIAQILNRLNVVDLRLTSTYIDVSYAKGYVFGYTKAAVNRILILGFFTTFIAIYKSNLIIKGLYSALACLIVVSILMAGSRAGILGVVVGMTVLMYRCRIVYIPFLLIYLAVLLLSGYYIILLWHEEALTAFKIFLPGSNMVSGRAEIARWTIEYLMSHWLILLVGVGLFNYSYALRGEGGGVFEHAHNDFLTCATECGLIGLVVFIWWITSFCKSLWFAGRKALGYERWASACINAGFWGLLSTMFFEQTLFPSGGSLSLNRLEIMLFGSFTAYYAQKKAREQDSFRSYKNIKNDSDT